MTLLTSLSLVTSNPAASRERGIVSMRQKLLDRLPDQITLADATGTGQAFQRVRYRRTRDLENDEVVETPVRPRVRPW